MTVSGFGVRCRRNNKDSSLSRHHVDFDSIQGMQGRSLTRLMKSGSSVNEEAAYSVSVKDGRYHAGMGELDACVCF